MIAQIVGPNLYQITYAIPTGTVNAFLLDTAEGMVLIDTGYTDGGQRILRALAQLKRTPADIRHILVTHGHVDHAGSLAALRRITGASAYMHPSDAAIVRQGIALRPTTTATTGALNRLAFTLGVRLLPKTVESSDIEHEISDGDLLPIAGGIRVIHTPGHSAGHVSFLWEHGGVLFAGDAAAHLLGDLRYGPVVEDQAKLQQSIAKLCRVNFTIACFGHGSPIKYDAAERFRRKWGKKSETL